MEVLRAQASACSVCERKLLVPGGLVRVVLLAPGQ
jgi:hypothetical protein